MADEQNTDGAAEEQIEGAEDSAESNTDSQGQGLTEEQVEKMLQTRMEQRDRDWQSKFDKLLEEKKQTETKSKTAEERMGELEQKYEAERIGRVRERAISSADLDSDIVTAAEQLLSNEDESVSSGAQKLSELIAQRAEKLTNERLEAEIEKRFPKDKRKPEGGKRGGELTYEELMDMSEEELQTIPRDQRLAIIEKAKQQE